MAEATITFEVDDPLVTAINRLARALESAKIHPQPYQYPFAPSPAPTWGPFVVSGSGISYRDVE